MAGPRASDWANHEEIIQANVVGFNPLMAFPKMIQKEFPDFRNFEFCFCSEDDLPDRRSKGWGFLEVAHLQEGMETLNKNLALRFGLSDDGAGHVRWRENWILIMPKKLREKVELARFQHSEEKFNKQIESQEYVAPGDARGHAESSLEEQSIQIPPQEEKPKRGRPKTKE